MHPTDCSCGLCKRKAQQARDLAARQQGLRAPQWEKTRAKVLEDVRKKLAANMGNFLPKDSTTPLSAAAFQTYTARCPDGCGRNITSYSPLTDNDVYYYVHQGIPIGTSGATTARLCPCGCGASVASMGSRIPGFQYTSNTFSFGGSILNGLQKQCTGGPHELAMGKVLAWRRFRVMSDGWLVGVRGINWPAGEMVAECVKYVKGYRTHKSPDESCTCGIYAFSSPDVQETGMTSVTTAYVNAVVECWGTVLIGTKGLRAEKARIVAIEVPSTTELPVDPGETYDAFLSRFYSFLGATPRMVAPKVQDIMRTRYPDAMIFDTEAAMLEAFPLSSILTEEA